MSISVWLIPINPISIPLDLLHSNCSAFVLKDFCLVNMRVSRFLALSLYDTISPVIVCVMKERIATAATIYNSLTGTTEIKIKNGFVLVVGYLTRTE